MGNKLHESVSAGNHFLGALYNLLSYDWRGDSIVFLGDQTNITEKDKNPVLRRLSSERKAWGEPGSDEDACTGLWLGNPIEVSDNPPPTGYKDMSEKYGWDRYK